MKGLCIDCIHRRGYVDERNRPASPHTCQRPTGQSPVDGRQTTLNRLCEDERAPTREIGPCGPEGHHFTPKEKKEC